MLGKIKMGQFTAAPLAFMDFCVFQYLSVLLYNCFEINHCRVSCYIPRKLRQRMRAPDLSKLYLLKPQDVLIHLPW